jgi:hypothetical protein
MASKSKANVQLADPNSLARQSSLFDATASYHEMMRKKKLGTTSIVSLAQDPHQVDKKRKPKVLYENTYKLEPDRKVEAWKIKKILNDVLENKLKDETYDAKSTKQLCLSLTEVIKQRIKELDYQRFRIVVTVYIGEMKEQGFRMGSRCLWEAKLDTFADAVFQNKSLFAIATVFMVYYE